MGTEHDLELVRGRLVEVARRSRKQHWAKERPWHPETHVGFERDLLVVDLHDLNANNATRAVRKVADSASDLETGAVCFVVGRAQHRPGGGVLGRAVSRQLMQMCSHNRQWRCRPQGPARWVLIFDPERAPRAVAGELGWGFWLLVAVFLLAAAFAIWTVIA